MFGGSFLLDTNANFFYAYRNVVLSLHFIIRSRMTMKKFSLAIIFFGALILTSGSSLAGVTLYEDINYGGTSETFTSDDSDLRDNLIGNDAVTAIKVSAGCTVTLYQDINYGGTSETFTSDDSDLRDNLIGNDAVTAIKVQCGTTLSGVTLYEDINYGGTSETFTSDDSDLRDNLIGNDAVTAIKVPAGRTVTLYSDINYGGTSETFTSDDPDLRDNLIGNDAVTAIKIGGESICGKATFNTTTGILHIPCVTLDGSVDYEIELIGPFNIKSMKAK
jgi:hypothetical protein